MVVQRRFPDTRLIPCVRRIESAGQGSGCSERELELLGLLRHGLSCREIGRLLGVTERTTRAYVATLEEKFGTTIAETVDRVFGRGILRRPEVDCSLLG